MMYPEIISAGLTELEEPPTKEPPYMGMAAKEPDVELLVGII